MSFHILHVSDYGCKLIKERGFLVCVKDKTELGRMPIEDIRALVLLNDSVAYSASILANLLANNAVILHCLNFKLVGVTLPLCRVRDAQITINQGAQPKILNRNIWNVFLRAKVANALGGLNQLGCKCDFLSHQIVKASYIDEALCAKKYWQKYFPLLGEYGCKRDAANEDSKPNIMLNYGYGVLNGLIHRALIIHGLSPLFGVCHKTYYKNTPLVFDVIEPFRAMVDVILANYFSENAQTNMAGWVRYLGKMLKEFRLRKGDCTLKLMDAIDTMVVSLADTYRHKDVSRLWVPYLDKKYEPKKREKKSLQDGLDSSNV